MGGVIQSEVVLKELPTQPDSSYSAVEESAQFFSFRIHSHGEADMGKYPQTLGHPNAFVSATELNSRILAGFCFT